MADSKISDLVEITTVLDTDIIPLVDDPAGTPVTKYAEAANVIGGVMNMARLYVATAATTQTVSSGTPEKLACFDTTGQNNGITPSAANDLMTVSQAGIYWVSASISFSGTANSTWTFQVYVSGSSTPVKMKRKLGAGGDVGSSMLGGMVTIASATATVAIYAEPGAAAQDVIVETGDFVLIRLGPS